MKFGQYNACRCRNLDVRLLASVSLVDFTRENVDVAIRLGRGTYDRLRSDLLMQKDLYPD